MNFQSTLVNDHPIFGEFKAFEGLIPEGFSYDFIGSLTDAKFSEEEPVRKPTVVKACIPSFNEEYFEWISLLEAVKAARKTFTIVELGAGYGRWTGRANKAARQRGIANVNSIMVEAEPMHAQWSREHMANNQITSAQVIEAMIGGTAGHRLFLIRQPGQAHVPAKEWYGQAADKNSPDAHSKTDETYFDRPIIDNGSGWGGINVEVKTLSSILDGIKSVDFLDMDVQGAEADVIEAGIRTMDKQVKLAHIGTHNADVEDRIRAVMNKAGWQKVWDFPCQSKTETPYGMVTFDDGVQTWRNPRFASSWTRLLARMFG